MKSETAQSVSQ